MHKITVAVANAVQFMNLTIRTYIHVQTEFEHVVVEAAHGMTNI